MADKSVEGSRPSQADLDFPAEQGWRELAAEGQQLPTLVPQKYIPGSTRGFEMVGTDKNAIKVHRVRGPLDEGNAYAVLYNLYALIGFTPPPAKG